MLTPSSARLRNESGVMMVLFAVMLPVLMLLASVVLTVGNWHVHGKRLQTLVDAAALAAGTKFTRCTSDPALNGPANAEIRAEALKFAGDTLRDPATLNLQEQEPGDVRVVLNSSGFWAAGDPTDGTGHDNTLGDPCSVKFLDVKATDDKAPFLWGHLPFVPSPKRHARVHLEIAGSVENVLPWAVPEVDPIAVAAIFIDEETGLTLYATMLNPQSAPPPLNIFNVWAGDVGAPFNVSSQNIGVIIMVSKVASPTLPSTGLQPDSACTAAPTRWRCYWPGTFGGTYNEGLSFIHGYDDDPPAGSAAAPIIRDVRLTAGSCVTDPANLSGPYYEFNGNCTVNATAVVDFGNGIANPPANPPAGIRAGVTIGGRAATWSGAPGTLGTWSTSSGISLGVESGRNVLSVAWNTQTGGGGTKKNGSFPKVAAPYVTDDNSGPVQFLELTAGGTLANSLPDGPIGTSVHVTVGLQPPLKPGQLVAMRVASGPGSKNQALDCDKGRTVVEEIVDGCSTPFAVNYNMTTKTWRDLDCDDYKIIGSPTFRYKLPVPAPWDPTPWPDCAALQTGDGLGNLRKAMNDRFESPCTDNEYHVPGGPKGDDRRWVTIVVTDATAFEGAGGSPDDAIPVKILGSFYVVGWTTGGVANGCPPVGPLGPGNEPPPVNWKLRSNSGDVWGYFRAYALPGSRGTGTGVDCNYDGIETCIAVLVE